MTGEDAGLVRSMFDAIDAHYGVRRSRGGPTLVVLLASEPRGFDAKENLWLPAEDGELWELAVQASPLNAEDLAYLGEGEV